MPPSWFSLETVVGVEVYKTILIIILIIWVANLFRQNQRLRQKIRRQKDNISQAYSNQLGKRLLDSNRKEAKKRDAQQQSK